MASFLTPKRSRFITPVNLPLISFALLIIIGTILLMLPVAVDGPRSHRWMPCLPLHRQHVLPVIEGYSIVELASPQEYVGMTLKELDLIDRFGIQVLAIKEFLPKGLTLIPRADFRVKHNNALIVLGPNETLEKMKKS